LLLAALVGLSALLVSAIRQSRTPRLLAVREIHAVAAVAGADPQRADQRTRASLSSPARLDPGGLSPPAEVMPPAPRRLEGAVFLAAVERTASLSSNQKARLERTLDLAARIQRGIDAVPDPHTQYDLELRLGAEVERRVQLIVPDHDPALSSDFGKKPVAFR
jgi:hypothetical protein